MMCAARLAERMGRVDAAFVERQRKLLEAFGLPLDVPDVDHDELIELMYRDKKVERGKLRFVLPTRLGHVELVRRCEERRSVGGDERKHLKRNYCEYAFSPPPVIWPAARIGNRIYKYFSLKRLEHDHVGKSFDDQSAKRQVGVKVVSSVAN